MSIKTDGLVEAGPFKVTATIPGAGFVKNNASGELEFGQAASAWDLIEFKSQIGEPLDFDAVVDGDVDEVYQIMWQAIAQSSTNISSGSLRINGVFPNTIGPSFVGFMGFINNGAFSGQSQGNGWRLWRDFGASNKSGIYGRTIIYAKSGKVRTGESWMSARRFLTNHEQHFNHRWNDTTTNITSLGIGSTFAQINRAWLYKIKTA